MGSELGGVCFSITPIPEEQRTDRRLYQFFFVWFSANANILTYVVDYSSNIPSRLRTELISVSLSAGTVGPAFFHLGILDSFFVIVVVDVM